MSAFMAGDIHNLLIDIASQFHRVCVKHGIPYYMMGGTMLGAVRHHGFIPWDDDMDFGIPREHYERFITICNNELPHYYKLLTYEKSDYAVLGYAKISDDRTIIKEIFSPMTDETLGVNIDIFPLDKTNGNKSLFSFNFFVRSAFKFQKLLFFNPENRPFLKKCLAIFAQKVFRFSKGTILKQLEKMLKRKGTEKNSSYYCNFFGAWGLKELLPISVFGEPRLYKFEETEFYGVEHYDAFLRSFYGDYNQLPPLNERHVHQIDILWKEDSKTSF